jgi:hypothetical protein
MTTNDNVPCTSTYRNIAGELVVRVRGKEIGRVVYQKSSGAYSGIISVPAPKVLHLRNTEHDQVEEILNWYGRTLRTAAKEQLDKWFEDYADEAEHGEGNEYWFRQFEAPGRSLADVVHLALEDFVLYLEVGHEVIPRHRQETGDPSDLIPY